MAPSDPLAKVRLGELYRDLGRADEAVRLLREAVALDPGRRPTGTRSAWCSAAPNARRG